MVDQASDELAGLAPTLASGWGDVRTTISMFGAAPGLEAQATKILDDFDVAFAERVDGKAPDGAIIAPLADDSFDTETSPEAYSALFSRAGFQSPQAVLDADTLGDGFANLSRERLDVLEGADVIVLFDFVGAETTDDLLATELFTRLPAVAGDRLLVVRGNETVDNEALFCASPLNLDICVSYVDRAVALANRGDTTNPSLRLFDAAARHTRLIGSWRSRRAGQAASDHSSER